MEVFVPELIDGALKHFPSRYELVRIAAVRANSLIRGDAPLIDKKIARQHKSTIVSLMEIKEGLWKRK
jgi:DNA-directed RNA polymerase omega subunit